MTHGAPSPYYPYNYESDLSEYYPYEKTKEFQFGSTRITLPALKVNKDTVIYVLNILGGNPEYIVNLSTDLTYGFENKFGMDVDGFITAEGKSIPLVYEIAFSYTLPYIVLRKSYKPYMGEKVLSAKVKSTTTPDEQNLYLDNKDLVNIVNKKLIFVDDVMTTGATLKACEKVVEMVAGKIVGCMSLAVEGDYTPDIPSYFLTRLPIIKIKK